MPGNHAGETPLPSRNPENPTLRAKFPDSFACSLRDDHLMRFEKFEWRVAQGPDAECASHRPSHVVPIDVFSATLSFRSYQAPRKIFNFALNSSSHHLENLAFLPVRP